MPQLTEEQRTVKNAAKFRAEFMNLHMAAVPVTMIKTREPLRCADALRTFAFAEKEMSFKSWSIVRGWASYNPDSPEQAPECDGISDLATALLAIMGGASNQANQGGENSAAWGDGVYAVLYPHKARMSENGGIIHIIKQYVQLFAENRKRLVLIVTPQYELPAELEDDIVLMDFDPPSYAELDTIFDKVVAPISEDMRPVVSKEARDRMISIGAGMTAHEFESAVARAVVGCRAQVPDVDPEDLCDIMFACKMEVIKKTDVLDLAQPEDMSNVGGLDNLKKWLDDRVVTYTTEATDFGIRPPRGITLVGPPGTGKSLVARATAFQLGLPLIEFDLSRVFQSLVGSSEARIRATLRLVDSMAPNVLLINELDKVLGGTVQGLQGDSGVGQRILGTILNWLQDSTAPVFVVATANRVEFLPPELLRRGRMDEIFSVQMPNAGEREEIFDIHLRKRGHEPSDIDDLDVAVEASSGYVGSELESAVKDSLIAAFNTGEKQVTGALIAEQLRNLKPLSVAFPEQFSAMAQWAANNARPANDGEPPPMPVRSRTRSPQASGSRAVEVRPNDTGSDHHGLDG